METQLQKIRGGSVDAAASIDEGTAPEAGTGPHD